MSIKPEKTPEISPGVRIRFSTPYGHMHVTIVVNLKEEREIEVFAQIGKSAEFIAAELEGLCRLASLYLRVGGTLTDVIKQLVGIGSMMSLRNDFKGEREKTISLPDSLGRALLAYSVFKKKSGVKALMLDSIIPDGEIDLMLFDPAKPETVYLAIVPEPVTAPISQPAPVAPVSVPNTELQ